MVFWFFVSLLTIYTITFFNQKNYYELQEKNRLQTFQLILNMQKSINVTCLKYDSESVCYENFIKNIGNSNLNGGVEVKDTVKNLDLKWINERYLDNRKSVIETHIFDEFTSGPQVTLSKLTRPKNLAVSSVNAMFFSIGDYYEYFVNMKNGEPSNFKNISVWQFTRFIAWGRFYPSLPMWVIAFFFSFKIIKLVLENNRLRTHKNKLTKEIKDKKNDLYQSQIKYEEITKSLREKLNQTNLTSYKLEQELSARNQHLLEITKEKNLVQKEKEYIEENNKKLLLDRNRLSERQNVLIKKIQERNVVLINLQKQVSFSKNQLQIYTKKENNLQNEVLLLKQEKIKLRKGIESSIQKIKSNAIYLEEYKKKILDLTKQLREAENLVSNLDNQEIIKKNDQKIKELVGLIDRLKNEKNFYEKDIFQLNEYKDNLSILFQEKSKQEENLISDLHKIQNELDKADKKSKKYEEDIRLLRKDIVALDKEIDFLKEENNLSIENQKILNQEKLKLEQRLKNYDVKIKNLENTIQVNQSEIVSLLNEKNTTEANLSKQSELIESQKKQILDLENEKKQLIDKHIEKETNYSSQNNNLPNSLLDCLIKNPNIQLSEKLNYAYSKHSSSKFVENIHEALNRNKKNKVIGLVTELRSIDFKSQYSETFKIVKNHPININQNREGWGLIAYGKNGYSAYMHLTAKNLGEAVLSAKAIQQYCSVFKNYKILPFNKGEN